MIIISNQAKRYGKAFIRHFYKNNTKLLPYDAYLAWKEHLPLYKKYLILLSMGSVTVHNKNIIIDEMIALYHFKTTAEKKLLQMLCKRRDIDLLPEIIAYFVSYYQNENNIEEWKITSAHPLSEKEKKTVIQTLEQKKEKTIVPTFITDETLYAGLTMRHPEQYWDCSLRSFLKKVATFAQNKD